MHPEHEEKTVAKWLKESQKGYMRIVFLILLSKKPCHGYEMMKEVRDRTEGFWRPTARKCRIHKGRMGSSEKKT